VSTDIRISAITVLTANLTSLPHSPILKLTNATLSLINRCKSGGLVLLIQLVSLVSCQIYDKLECQLEAIVLRGSQRA
jgi:hypothetical protein